MRTLLIAMLTAMAIHAQTDAPKRTLFDAPQKKDGAAGRPSAPVRDPGSSALDALISSTENLNNIRDSNVRRLSGEGCSPIAAARIGDLRAKLGIRAEGSRKDAGSEAASIALAANWYKLSAAEVPAMDPRKQADVLNAVLSGGEPKPQAPQDTASLRSELEGLMASCTGTKR